MDSELGRFSLSGSRRCPPSLLSMSGKSFDFPTPPLTTPPFLSLSLSLGELSFSRERCSFSLEGNVSVRAPAERSCPGEKRTFAHPLLAPGITGSVTQSRYYSIKGKRARKMAPRIFSSMQRLHRQGRSQGRDRVTKKKKYAGY